MSDEITRGKIRDGQQGMEDLRRHLESLMRRPVVLLVDDDEKDIELLREEIAKFDAEILVARSGMEALAIIRERLVDIALVDLKMPGFDGLDLLTKAMQVPQFVIVTGEVASDRAIQATKLGAVNIWKKPVTPQMLEGVLRRAR